MPTIINKDIDYLLETTSRSFFLTLQNLPKKIRRQLSLLYLLARIADTIADSNEGEKQWLLENLQNYNSAIKSTTTDFSKLRNLQEISANPSETKLLRNFEEVINSISIFDDDDQQKIRSCLDIIISGQILDLERFGISNQNGTISSLSKESELDDYTYRVAGSVGEFWTSMSLKHLFSIKSSQYEQFFDNGIRFGKALQMINILRDIPEDLRIGRCYIPTELLDSQNLTPHDLLEPKNMYKFKPIYDKYIEIAFSHLESAIEYILTIPFFNFRLRASCMLPVLIGSRTLNILKSHNILDYTNRAKISRTEVDSIISKIKRNVLLPRFSRSMMYYNLDRDKYGQIEPI